MEDADATTPPSGVSVDDRWVSIMSTLDPERADADDLATLAALIVVTDPLDIKQATFAWLAAAPHLRYRRVNSTVAQLARAIAASVVTAPDLPAPTLIDFAARGPRPSLELLAARTDLPRRAMMTLYRRAARPGRRALVGYQEAQVALALNPAFPPERVPLLADSSIPRVRAAAASRPDLPRRTARRLLRDTDRGTLAALAANPYVDDTVRVLAVLASSSLEEGLQ